MAQDNSVQSSFELLIERVPGLLAVIASDKDGVSLLRATQDSVAQSKSDSALSAAFTVATEQASKLQLGRNQTITSFYQDFVLIHVNHMPIVITLLASADANLGFLLSLVPRLKASLEPIRVKLQGDE
eukprot:TRINITY_DN4275_c0_g1_i9.p1 TRINITY_DN4275_c0_g1~~TRINITY_DN4275_c0_g1_i9.p1  ORF type:complete len:146 (-),score=38.40 TRINITY_DN4275_c0_g1_i9:304-687(-)